MLDADRCATDLAALPKFGELVDILYGGEKAPVCIHPCSQNSYDSMTAAFKVERESRYDCRFHSSIINHELFNAVDIELYTLNLRSRCILSLLTDHFAKLLSVLFRISALIVQIICITTYNKSYYTSRMEH